MSLLDKSVYGHKKMTKVKELFASMRRLPQTSYTPISNSIAQYGELEMMGLWNV
jgi:hypothetical protein